MIVSEDDDKNMVANSSVLPPMTVLIVERIGEFNTYIKLLADAYKAAGHTAIFDVQNFLFSNIRPDIVHVHWPEAIYKWRHRLPYTEDSVELIENRLRWYRTHGVSIVFTVHNLAPHESREAWFETALNRLFLRYADVVVHLGDVSVSMVQAVVPECRAARHIIVAHGDYPPVEIPKKDARTHYALPDGKRVILNLGRQNNYKGPDFIFDVFSELADKDSWLFTIGTRSGDGSPRLWRKAIRLAVATSAAATERAIGRFRRRTTVWRRYEQDEVPSIMAASDIVLLGHQSGLNSGVAALAASYSKPVVFPDLGNFSQQLSGWPWVETYQAGEVDSAVAALKRLTARLDAAASGSDGFDNSDWLERNRWSSQIRAIEEAIASQRVHDPSPPECGENT